MKNILILIFFLSINCVFILSCKKDDSNLDSQCLQAKRLIDYYSRNENTILPFLDYNNENATEYFVFKKFNLVSSVHYEYIISDSCAEVRVNEILKEKKGVALYNIKTSIDSFNKLKGNSLINKDFDGVFCEFGYVRVKPMENSFKDKLLVLLLDFKKTYKN
jgi:hypothetical protein